MGIQWDLKDQSSKLVDVLHPEFTPNGPQPIAPALEKFLVAVGELTTSQKYNFPPYKIKSLALFFPPKTDLYSLKISDSKKILTAPLKNKLSLESRKDVRGILHKVIDFCVIGKVQVGERHFNSAVNGHANGTMKIRPASIDMIKEFPDLMYGSGYRNGRFAEQRMAIFDALKNAAPGELRIIEPTNEMITDKKERHAFIQSAVKITSSIDGDWIIRWSEGRKIFILVRKADLEKMRNGGK